MNHRQRVLAALNHQQPDRVPIDLGSTIVTSIAVPAYDRLKKYLSLDLGPSVYFEESAQLAVVDEPVLQRFDIDTRGIRPNAVLPPTDVVFEPDSLWDEWGFWRKRSPETNTYFLDKAPLAGEISKQDILNYPWPIPKNPVRTAGLRKKALDLVQQGDHAIILSIPAGFILLSMELRGFEDWYMDTSLNPDLLGFLMDQIIDIQMSICSDILEEAGDLVDVVVNLDDLALQERLMVSPKVYKNLLEPRLRRLYLFVKSHTRAKILHHTDGAVRPLLGSLIDMGVDAVNPLQVSAKEMDDLTGLKQEFGAHLTFWGGIDTQKLLPFGTPAEVSDTVRRTLEILNKDGGYVLASVHNIQKDVPPENVVAMYDTALNT